MDEIQLSLGLADSFEYLLCQQMAATAQLYSWQITKVCLQTIKNSKMPTKPSDGWISSTYWLSFYFSLFSYVKDFIISRFTIPYPNLLVTRNHHYIYMHRKLCCLAVHHTYLGTYQATHYLESTLAHIKARWPHMKWLRSSAALLRHTTPQHTRRINSLACNSLGHRKILWFWSHHDWYYWTIKNHTLWSYNWKLPTEKSN